jgi:hypothetical protein
MSERAPLPRYLVVLEELPSPVSGIARLRRLLKRLLRAYDLRAVSIRVVREERE